MTQPVDKKKVLVEYDAQLAAIEKVCVVMRELRPSLEAAMALSDAEFTATMTSVAEAVSREMDKAAQVLPNG